MSLDWKSFHEKARQLEKDGKCQEIYQLAIDCFKEGKVSWAPMTCGRAASVGPPTREQAQEIASILLSAGAGNRKYTLQKIARWNVDMVWYIIRRFDFVEQRDMLRDLQEIASLQAPPADLAEIRDMSDEQLWRQILLPESPDATEIAEAIKRVPFPAEEEDLVEKLKTLSESGDSTIADALIQSPNLAMTQLDLFACMSERSRFESLKRQLDESGLFQQARINIRRKRMTLRTTSLGRVIFDKAVWKNENLTEQMKAKEGHVQALELVKRVLQSAMLAQKGIQWRIEARRPQVTVIEPAEPAAENVPASATKQTSKKLEGPACLRNVLILKPDSANYIIRPVLVLRSEPSTKEQFETEFRYRTRFLDAPGVHFPLRLGEETEAAQLSVDIPNDVIGLPRVTPVPIVPVDWLNNISRRNNAVVATNANFFAHAEEEFVASYSAFKEPIGFIMSDGKLLVPPACRRGVLLIDQDGQPHITRMSMRNTIIRFVKQKVGFWGEESPTDRRSPYPGSSAPFFVAPFQSKDSEAKNPWTPARNGKSSEVLLYSRAYGMRTPQSSDRIEIGVSFEWVVFVNFHGDNPIPSGGFVLSIPRYDLMKDKAKEKLVENFLPNADEDKRISVGDRAKINAYPPEEIIKQGCRRIFHAICGLRILRWNRKESEPLPSNFFKDDVTEEWQEDFREGVTTPTDFTYSVDYEPAPRTAIGIRINKKHEKELAIAVLDGERLHGAGYTLAGLAQFMKELGCSDAINLDGGGSSEMVVCNEFVNKPSDDRERLMPVGLVVVPIR